jgi:N-hydroxyarylamine O-acetyltransferase
MAAIDLDAYFDRIRWGGAPLPSHATLAGILAAHMSAIPFENIDVLLGRGIRLDLEGLQAKLVSARRGGYCFEHASLLAAVLAQLGFKPVPHLARVVLMAPRTVASRGHMFLTVPLPEGRFLVDPGFGALAPRIPVPVADRRETSIDHETHWLERDGDYWTCACGGRRRRPSAGRRRSRPRIRATSRSPITTPRRTPIRCSSTGS